jgi:CHASE3 domain sensor protein
MVLNDKSSLSLGLIISLLPFIMGGLAYTKNIETRVTIIERESTQSVEALDDIKKELSSMKNDLIEIKTDLKYIKKEKRGY